MNASVPVQTAAGAVTQESVLTFPCDFPLKIMGLAQADFTAQVLAIVCRHAPDFDNQQLQARFSSGGKYLALTCTIHAVSRAQLDTLYRELTAHPLVKVVL